MRDPYYVSLLAPFAAGLVGALVGVVRSGGLPARVVGPAAIAAGAVTELVVLDRYPDDLAWLPPILVVIAVGAALALAMPGAARWRSLALAIGLGALLIAPAAWSAETLGHPTSGTFPAGGPESAANTMGGPPGGGPFGGLPGGPGAGSPGAPPPGFAPPPGLAPGGGIPGGTPSGTPQIGAIPPGEPALPGAPGGLGGDPDGAPTESLDAVVSYTEAHGGGTIGVSSQQEAAGAIVSSDAPIAGLGGFSGRESTVSVSWLADAVREGRVRWVLSDGSGTMQVGQDGRTGSADAFSAAAASCRRIPARAHATGSATSSASGGTSGTQGSAAGRSSAADGQTSSSATLYDCAGRAEAIAAA